MPITRTQLKQLGFMEVQTERGYKLTRTRNENTDKIWFEVKDGKEYISGLELQPERLAATFNKEIQFELELNNIL